MILKQILKSKNKRDLFQKYTDWFSIIRTGQIEYLAKLAKLELSKKELEKYSKDLSGILDYVSEISELNLKNIEPTSYAAGPRNIMHQDKIKKLEFKNANSGQYFETKAIFA